MRTSEVLTRARQLLVDGWHPGVCTTSDGRICADTDEMVSHFALDAALDLAAGFDFDRAEAAEMALNRQLERTGSPLWLRAWDVAPGRTHAEVLELVARAVARTRAEEARHGA